MCVLLIYFCWHISIQPDELMQSEHTHLTTIQIKKQNPRNLPHAFFSQITIILTSNAINKFCLLLLTFI